MAQNITLLGASYADVPAVLLPKTGGGTATFTDVTDGTATAADVKSGKNFYTPQGILTPGTLLWDYRGDECEFVQQVYSEETALKDTLYASWTASTTAKAIVATKNAGTFSADMVNYEYLLRWKFEFDAAYKEGVTPTGITCRECAELWQVIYKRPNSVANLAANNFNSNGCITYFSTPLNVYYNSNGVLSYTYSITYGFYPAVTAATFSNSTSNTPTVTIKTPTVNARCCSTSYSYFLVASAGDIDQTNSKYKMKGELYRIKVGGAARKMYENLVDIYNNGV